MRMCFGLPLGRPLSLAGIIGSNPLLPQTLHFFVFVWDKRREVATCKIYFSAILLHLKIIPGLRGKPELTKVSSLA